MSFAILVVLTMTLAACGGNTNIEALKMNISLKELT